MFRKMRDSRRRCIVSRIRDLMERCTMRRHNERVAFCLRKLCESESFEISLKILFLFVVVCTLSRIVYKHENMIGNI